MKYGREHGVPALAGSRPPLTITTPPAKAGTPNPEPPRTLARLALALTVTILFGHSLPAQPVPHRADNTLSFEEKQVGWLLLFDGTTLNGWMTSAGLPSKTPVEDGCINPHNCGDYMMVHTQQWSNFELRLDFKISPGCNSGVFVRTSPLTPRPGKDVGFNGIEVQILDSPAAGYYDTGAIYDLSKPSKNAMKPVGQWNHLEITCNRSLLDVVLNGEAVNHLDLAKFTEPNKRPDGSAHKFDVAYKDHPRTGYIGLQDHGSPCWFKNIKLRSLGP